MKATIVQAVTTTISTPIEKTIKQHKDSIPVYQFDML